MVRCSYDNALIKTFVNWVIRRPNFLEDWNKVRNSASEEEVQNNWNSFCEQYPSTWIGYINREWWKYKDHFVKYFTDQHMHFNTLVTSRVEGNHALMKKQKFNAKNASIDELIQSCGDHIQHQYSLATLRDQQEVVRIPVCVATDNLFDDVKGKISSTAIQLISSQVAEAKRAYCDPLHPLHSRRCTGVFTKTMGLPCSHKCIDSMTANSGKLSLNLFVNRWKLGLLSHEIPANGNIYPTAPNIITKKSKSMSKQGAPSTNSIQNRNSARAKSGRILSTFERESFPECDRSVNELR
jgi:hypothetical protein